MIWSLILTQLFAFLLIICKSDTILEASENSRDDLRHLERNSWNGTATLCFSSTGNENAIDESLRKIVLGPEEEQVVLTEISKAYREGVLYYQQRSYLIAKTRFLDVVSLCQLSERYLQEPQKIKIMHKEALSHLESIRNFHDFSDRVRGLKQRLKLINVATFSVKEAELETVFQLIRNRVAQADNGLLPNFVLHVSKKTLAKKISLNVREMSMLTILELVLKASETEILFERRDAIISELPVFEN